MGEAREKVNLPPGNLRNKVRVQSCLGGGGGCVPARGKARLWKIFGLRYKACVINWMLRDFRITQARDLTRCGTFAYPSPPPAFEIHSNKINFPLHAALALRCSWAWVILCASCVQSSICWGFVWRSLEYILIENYARVYALMNK